MGASLFCDLAPWNSDPSAALQQLQIACFEQHYDLSTEIPRHLESMRQAGRSCEQDDEYGLLELYQGELRRLEEYASRPLPESPIERIAMLRKIWEYGGEGLGNVLDLRSVSDQRDYSNARRLREHEIEQLFRTPEPSPMTINQLPREIDVFITRGECVCYPVYEEGKPCGWQFVGYSVD